ncbi:MAG: hypothetical protein QOF21_1422 [Actinomycetota bacterium]
MLSYGGVRTSAQALLVPGRERRDNLGREDEGRAEDQRKEDSGAVQAVV